jgi:hypothetical protein
MPPGRLQIGTVAAFVSEWVAGIILECMAGFVGIRIYAAFLPAVSLLRAARGETAVKAELQTGSGPLVKSRHPA